MMKTTADVRRGEVQLTPRDMKMLAAVDTWGVMGIGQMFGLGLAQSLSETETIERFFNKMERDDYELGLAKRLHALEVADFLQSHQFQRQPKAYTLTFKGRAAISDEPTSSRPDPRASVSEAMIRHDLKVSAVGLVLTHFLGLPARREHPQVVWTSTNGRRHLTLEGAADLWIDTPAPRAVEVELTQKSRRRYEEIFDSYRRRLGAGGAVLYLTGWPQGSAMILRNARDFRAPFVFACALDDFRRMAGRCVFESAVEGRTLVLSDRSAVGTSMEAAR